MDSHSIHRNHSRDIRRSMGSQIHMGRLLLCGLVLLGLHGSHQHNRVCREQQGWQPHTSSCGSRWARTDCCKITRFIYVTAMVTSSCGQSLNSCYHFWTVHPIWLLLTIHFNRYGKFCHGWCQMANLILCPLTAGALCITGCHDTWRDTWEVPALLKDGHHCEPAVTGASHSLTLVMEEVPVVAISLVS